IRDFHVTGVQTCALPIYSVGQGSRTRQSHKAVAQGNRRRSHRMAKAETSVHSGAALSERELNRYSRQMILAEVGVEGQKKLKEAKVLIIGAGGLGSPSSIYLAAAGVGTIGVIDADKVGMTNLHRQVLHTDADVGRPKTASAREHLEALNPDIQVVEHHTFL